MTTRHASSRLFRRLHRWLLAAALAPMTLVGAGPAVGEIVFLEDGRVIQADKVEVQGDRVRIEGPGMSLDLPQREVLSIHPTPPPGGTPPKPSPAETYRDLPQQLQERIRRDLEGR